MANINSIDLTSEDFIGGDIHMSGTVVFTTSGPGAIKLSYINLLAIIRAQSGIENHEVQSLYRFEDAHRFYLRLTPRAHDKYYESLHGADFRADSLGVSAHAEHLDKERIRCTVHWVPPSMKKDALRKVVGSFAEGEFRITPTRNTSDKHQVWFRPRGETPHYIKIRMEQGKYHLLLITMPGRLQQCRHCSATDHWSSRCMGTATATAPPNDVTTNTTAPAPRKATSYAAAVAATPPQAPTPAYTDAVMTNNISTPQQLRPKRKRERTTEKPNPTEKKLDNRESDTSEDEDDGERKCNKTVEIDDTRGQRQRHDTDNTTPDLTIDLDSDDSNSNKEQDDP